MHLGYEDKVCTLNGYLWAFVHPIRYNEKIAEMRMQWPRVTQTRNKDAVALVCATPTNTLWIVCWMLDDGLFDELFWLITIYLWRQAIVKSLHYL